MSIFHKTKIYTDRLSLMKITQHKFLISKYLSFMTILRRNGLEFMQITKIVREVKNLPCPELNVLNIYQTKY